MGDIGGKYQFVNLDLLFRLDEHCKLGDSVQNGQYINFECNYSHFWHLCRIQ